MAEMRTIVDDVEQAVAFYTAALGFGLVQQYGPAMAIIERGDLTLWLAGPAASASRAMPDGRKPVPGGWNRIVLRCDDLAADVARFRSLGLTFRSDIVLGPGGKQVLIEDPSGNPIELFEAAKQT
jgi:catechol 2,3-dioxygenase-like lactoylglutathione lyase family enzyme